MTLRADSSSQSMTSGPTSRLYLSANRRSVRTAGAIDGRET